MVHASSRCSRSTSAGLSLSRIVISAAAVVALVLLLLHLFPTRRARLWTFIEERRDDLVALRESEFLAGFDPEVAYQRGRGLDAIRADYARWKAVKAGKATITGVTTAFDDAGADVEFDVLYTAGFTVLTSHHVRMRVEDGGGAFKVKSLTWE